MANHVDPNLHVHWELRDILNDHHRVTHVEMKTAPFKNRTFVNRLLWKKLSDAPPTYVWGALPLDAVAYALPDSMHNSDSLRAENTRCVRFTDLDAKTTTVEYVFTLDLRGNFPAWFQVCVFACVREWVRAYALRLCTCAVASARVHGLRARVALEPGAGCAESCRNSTTGIDGL